MEIRIAKFGGHNVRHVFISRRYVNFGRTYEHVDGIKKITVHVTWVGFPFYNIRFQETNLSLRVYMSDWDWVKYEGITILHKFFLLVTCKIG